LWVPIPEELEDLAMRIWPESALVSGLETTFDAVPSASPTGDVLWATVTIDYIWAGLEPSVAIRVPVPWEEGLSPEQLKGLALRSARRLIDHACQASTFQPAPAPQPVDEEGILTPGLAGLAQELGLSEPTTKPRKPEL
jgi:hypothetical protein